MINLKTMKPIFKNYSNYFKLIDSIKDFMASKSLLFIFKFSEVSN